MKGYFNKNDRDAHSQFLILAFFVENWLKETTALTKDESKFLKTATTYLFKVHELIKARLGNRYCKTLHNDLKAFGKEFDATKGADFLNADDMLENMANSDVKILSEYVSMSSCKNCTQSDFLACNIYHVFARNNIQHCTRMEKEGCD